MNLEGRKAGKAESAEPVRITLGDLTATLHLGDCLAVLATFKSDSVEMIWTDPPYGHSNHVGDLNARLNDYREITGSPIENDGPLEMRSVVDGMLTEAARVLRPDCCCCCCCCGGGGPRPTFAWVANRMDCSGLEFFHSIIWDKMNPGLGWRYRRQHEMIMVSHRKGGKLAWNDDYPAQPNVMRISKPRGDLHPNVKPVELVQRFIQQHTAKAETVLDPFMGSGTTGVACLRTGRNFIGIEKDPKHFATAVERLEREARQGVLI
jgi:site-specific DNA-methyltransferase (adenine-specific)